jgi:hypothetical protein
MQALLVTGLTPMWLCVYLVAGHGPLGIDEPGGVGNGLAGIAVAAQVGHHDRVVLAEDGGNVAPREVVLRIAVQQHRGGRPCQTPVGTLVQPWLRARRWGLWRRRVSGRMISSLPAWRSRPGPLPRERGE